MPGYTDAVGGAPIGVATGSYTSFSMSVNVQLAWPQYAVSQQPFARLMDVTPTAQNLTLSLPDATLASNGEACIVNNKGAYAFTLLDSSGNTLAVIQPSEVRYAYLMDSSTAAGLWALVLFGKSNSSQDAGQFAGPGLKAINNTLAWAPITTLVSGTATLDLTYRGKVLVYTGGAGTLTLPDLSAVGNDFVIEFRNQGSGVVTLAPVNSQTIDGSSNATFVVNESCLIHASSTGWYSVGRGRSVQFAFTQLVKNIAGGGGTTTLSLTEASSVIQSYIGALSGQQTIVVPSVVQVYYVSNQTTGGNNVVFKSPTTGGTQVSLAPGQNAVLFCDGTNVVNANTTTAGLSALLLGSGSVGAPILSIGGASNGFYSPGTNQLGIAINGVGLATWNANGAVISGPSVASTVTSTAGAASFVVDRISGQTGSVRMRTSGVDRFALEVSNAAETGSNVGSDLNLNAYSDAGSGGNVWTVSRSTRVVAYTFLPSAAGASLVNVSAAQTLTNKTIDGASNTLRNVNLQSQVAGVLPVANGGTGNTSGITSTNLATQVTGVLGTANGGTGNSNGTVGASQITGVLSTANGGTGNASGVAVSANTLTTARNITLTGAVTGAVSFNGSADVVINTSMGASTVTAASLNGGQSGSAPVFGLRAWAALNLATSVLLGAGNIASVTGMSGGLFTLNFATAMPNANYGVGAITNGGAGITVVPTSLTTTSATFKCEDISNTGVPASYVSILIVD